MQFEKKWYGYVKPLRKLIVVLILLIALCAVSCRTQKNGVGLPPSIAIEVPKVVPVYIPPDSTWLRAYLECDSNNQVILKGFEELKSGGVNSSLKLDSGILDYKAKAVHDTLYIIGKDSIIYVPYEVAKEINLLTWWQELWVRMGKLAVAVLVLWILCIWIKKRFKP